jgi:hypothetical protein
LSGGPSDRAVAPTSPTTSRPDPDVIRLPDLPAAAAPPARPTEVGRSGRLGPLYLLTLLSTVDGSLLLLSASGQLSSPGSALAVGLTVIAGAGSWLAARQAFAGQGGRRAFVALGLLGVVTLAATVASVLLGNALGTALTLHVLPKATGVVLLLVAADVGGLTVPRVRGLPLPVAVLAVAGVLEALTQWIR